ncbi:hypothetical protein MED16_gp47 [Pantoea phage vB_PagS_MED16]|nr:hypothetical protein MED16_gp47 [Pantoea phage vB_PagS_MED16]
MQHNDLPPEISSWIARIPVALAGAAGAFVVVVSKAERKTGAASLSFIMCGLLVAVFCAPALCDVVGIKSDSMISLISFATGTGWSSVVTKVQNWLTGVRMPGGSE